MSTRTYAHRNDGKRAALREEILQHQCGAHYLRRDDGRVGRHRWHPVLGPASLNMNTKMSSRRFRTHPITCKKSSLTKPVGANTVPRLQTSVQSKSLAHIFSIRMKSSRHSDETVATRRNMQKTQSASTPSTRFASRRRALVGHLSR
ncbi:unnamed protein product [Prorocentrum cordatum]|uniref:Uncharacterized protein n=1 Tax=Prorocentrum cordatum TaxID=2364126 RepID=A0ABN9T7H1_9DINO|nr:unnamed protein product [Polarella glacialis]